MAKATKLTVAETRHLKGLVSLFEAHATKLHVIVENLEREILTMKDLAVDIHSLRRRIKDPEHLLDKLERKAHDAKAKRQKFPITTSNLFRKINDLAGIRILHLHTEQFANINQRLLQLFHDHSYPLIEGPKARTWDDESRRYFSAIGVKTIKSPSLYTSVHYVIRAHTTVPYTCELQVRTLMEEVWGEVDHSVNYPRKTGSLACREQILALARSTS